MSKETVIKTVGVDFGNGCSVVRKQVNATAMDYEYKVEVTRDGELHFELECGTDFFQYSEVYREECENMRDYVANKPKQGELL